MGKSVGDDFREGKITLPVVLAFRRGSEDEQAFWRRTLEVGKQNGEDLERAIHLLHQHGALTDTLDRARHFGAIARDALAIFPPGPEKDIMLQVVDFCINRAH
jgi:octaprenyl-diphosphate synthase